MNALLTSFFILMFSISASAQLDDDFKLPANWNKDFTITLAHHGSMSGGSTEITFNYNYCKYVIKSRIEKAEEKIYALNDADRAMILKRLQEWKVEKIKSLSSVHSVRDGWSESICFNTHCIQGGPRFEMSKGDKVVYSEVYNFLEEFAINKCK